MSECDHPWHNYLGLPFPCPACGAGTDEEEPMTDYHELPEAPRCCGTCRRLVADCVPMEDGPWQVVEECNCLYLPVARHGYCSHWERRDG